ncbi:MAG: ribosome recycling factor [Dehalococcoidia bacterium]|nr:ribosome recycling factor [Dehalococcoidia bacterium]
MTTSLLPDAESRMHKAGDVLKREMNTIRTGRASPALVEGVIVDYHGVPTPLNQLATISAPEARLLLIQPWDKQSVTEIERGILKSGLGLNPAADGAMIRVPIPQLTEERRRDFVKMVRQHAEEARVAVRNVRRDVQDKLRAMERSKEISQDESRRQQDRLQKLTDAAIVQINTAVEGKEAEVMEV